MAVPTAAVFATPELTRDSEPLKIQDFSALLGAGRLRNDLEPVVAARFPVVAEHLAWLGRVGGGRLTGSGACVFARFGDRAAADEALASLPETMSGFVAQGMDAHPLRGL